MNAMPLEAPYTGARVGFAVHVLFGTASEKGVLSTALR